MIRDDATKVYPCIAESDTLLYVSHIRYGGYDTVFKTMLERAIPVQQAFIRIYRGETHHVQRAVRPKNATILAYGDLAEEEKDIFRQLVARNASNMNFPGYTLQICGRQGDKKTRALPGQRTIPSDRGNDALEQAFVLVGFNGLLDPVWKTFRHLCKADAHPADRRIK